MTGTNYWSLDENIYNAINVLEINKEFITETVQIQKAVELINGIENERFLLLIQRILLKLHSNYENPFHELQTLR